MLTKSQRLTIRLSPGEQQEIELAAYAKGVSPSEFVRTVAAYCAKELVQQLREENRA